MSTPLCNFINGEFVAANASSVLDVVSPSTGKAVARVPLSSASDLNRAVEGVLF